MKYNGKPIIHLLILAALLVALVLFTAIDILRALYKLSTENSDIGTT